MLWIVRGTSNILRKIYKKLASPTGGPGVVLLFCKIYSEGNIMKKLSPEEALAKVKAFEQAAGAVVESVPAKKEEDVKPMGVAADSFTMPVKEVVELTPTPEVAAKSKKTAEK